jgi:FkbM family methyltransferase
METGSFEPEETMLIQQLLTSVDVFVDVGANVGLFACLARRLGKYTIAIEPLRENLDFLYANLEINGWRDVEVYPVGLAHHPGLATLHGFGTGASLLSGWANIPASLCRTIPVSTLDIILGDRFQGQHLLIKVDVEGAEFDLLKGAGAVMASDPAPTWIMEICLTDHHPAGINPHFLDTFNTMWRRGYRSWTADRERHPVEPATVERWLEQGKCDFGKINFLFLKDDS